MKIKTMKLYFISILFILVCQQIFGQVHSNKYSATMFNEQIALIVNSAQFQELSNYKPGVKWQISSNKAKIYNAINSNSYIEFTEETRDITLLSVDQITPNYVFIKLLLNDILVSYLLQYNRTTKTWNIYRCNMTAKK